MARRKNQGSGTNERTSPLIIRIDTDFFIIHQLIGSVSTFRSYLAKSVSFLNSSKHNRFLPDTQNAPARFILNPTVNKNSRPS